MKIKAISSVFPKKVVENSEIERWCGLKKEIIEKKIGVKKRFFLEKNETGTDLSVNAVLNLCKENPEFDLNKVGLMVVVTQNPDYQLPHNSALLQKALDLSKEVPCFDVSLGCSGFVYALSIVKGFMYTEKIDEALLITCDPYSRCMDKKDRNVIGLFGDAATATWIKSDGQGEILRGDFGTDGSGFNNLIINTRLNEINKTEKQDNTFLKMNGRAIFNFMMNKVGDSISKCLKKNNLKENEIDLFILHQASRFLLEQFRKRENIPEKKMPIHLENYGNTVSSSIPIVLQKHLRKKDKLIRNILISGFGVGLSWATNIIKLES